MAAAIISITRDDLRPALARLTALGRDTTPVMRSMGTTFQSITEGNFNSAGASFRPTPWPPKKDGSPSNLKRTGLLWHSFHLTYTATTASLSNPTPYAAIHQFGSDKKKGRGSGIPPRRFYPILNDQLTPAAQDKIIAAGLRTIARLASGK